MENKRYMLFTPTSEKSKYMQHLDFKKMSRIIQTAVLNRSLQFGQKSFKFFKINSRTFFFTETIEY